MIWLLLSCTGGDTTDDSATTTTDTQDTGPFDLDGDGSFASDDCDDLDDRRHPGADEVFDEVDNDCDGLVDADGTYTGTAELSAITFYSGAERTGEFDCTAALSRSLAVLDFAVTCPVTHDDPDEQEVLRLMMGAELVITPAPGYEDVAANLWTGRAVITAEVGWDSTGEAQVAWTDTASARFSLTLDAEQLGLSGTGILAR